MFLNFNRFSQNMQISTLEKEHSIWAKCTFDDDDNDDDDDIDTCKINRNGTAIDTQTENCLFIKWNGVNKNVSC